MEDFQILKESAWNGLVKEKLSEFLTNSESISLTKPFQADSLKIVKKLWILLA